MAFDVDTAGARPKREASGRCLKTAAEALQALHVLGTAPEGVDVDALAGELGKSKATARYLLNTLCHEGYARRDGANGIYRLASAPPWAETWGRPAHRSSSELPALLADLASELYGRTNQRTYLACLEEETTAVVDMRGCQGLSRIPGLSSRIPAEQAHALAVSKALVAMSPELEKSLRENGSFESFTDRTVTDPSVFGSELARVRREGFALDAEEFADGFCCIAAPVFDPDGQIAASLAISVLSHRFAADSTALIDAVVDVAEKATEEWRLKEHQSSREVFNAT